MKLGLGRIQELVLNLRRFSRLDEGDFQTVNVPESIETVLALLGHKLGTPDRRAPPLRARSRPLLLAGAAEPGRHEHHRQRRRRHQAAPAPSTIETESDDDNLYDQNQRYGPGIPPELRERIFEPFFTTKPVGAGTGLGLAIAYSVVQAHKGSITVDSGPQGGASFTITIPRQIVA